MMGLKLGILGTRGIPNNYGGYEQAATYLSQGLVALGHEVTVYNSHNHPYKEKEWNGVEIVHCFDPEYKAGTAGQFIYDLNCIRHARKRNYDVLLLMGYTSSSLWGRFYPSKTVIISNMDGLEWKRSKYSAAVRKYLQIAEKWAVEYSDHFIADSPVIQDYLKSKYHIDSRFIPYGAEIKNGVSADGLRRFNLQPHNYYLLIARMEPENNIETILDGYAATASAYPFVVVGNPNNKFGRRLQVKYRRNKNIIFVGAVFDQSVLHDLKTNCCLYFHGHSVGGTNPSLLEAMASQCLIAAHDNPFNKAVLGDQAIYFAGAEDVTKIIQDPSDANDHKEMTGNNLEKIRSKYSWDTITRQYHDFIMECQGVKKK